MKILVFDMDGTIADLYAVPDISVRIQFTDLLKAVMRLLYSITLKQVISRRFIPKQNFIKAISETEVKLTAFLIKKKVLML